MNRQQIANEARLIVEGSEDQLLLVVDNNANALNAVLEEVESGGNVCVFCQQKLYKFLTQEEYSTVRLWFDRIIYRLSFMAYISYWINVHYHYRFKVEEMK